MKNKKLFELLSMIGVLIISLVVMTAFASAGGAKHGKKGKDQSVQLGPRPFYLVDKMSDGDL